MISPKQLVLLLGVMLGGVLTSVIFNIWLWVGFLPGMILLVYFSLKLGFDKRELMSAAMQGVNSVKVVAYILLLVSFLIPCWMAAGVISYMISLGLQLIEPAYFLISSFLLTAGVALLLGTSTGSLSAIGVPLMGVGSLLGVPPALTGGAVVSGAFVGDRTSPLASANQLVAACAEISMAKQMRAIFPTGLVAVIATALFYYWLDAGRIGQQIPGSVLYNNSIQAWPYFGEWLLLPPVLLVAAILCHFNTITCFCLAITSGIFLGSLCQGITLEPWLVYLFYGYQSGDGALVLQGKGAFYMLPLILFILLTGAFNGILDHTGMVRPYFAKIIGKNTSLSTSTMRLGLFGLLLNGICCNQTMPIMITAGSLRSVWIQSFTANQLARVVADTSLVLAGLIPWNLFAMVCSSIIGVPVLEYAGYAAFLWLIPVVTLVWSCLVQRGLFPNCIGNSNNA